MQSQFEKNEPMKNPIRTLFLSLIFASSAAFAQGGPPMVTDDPGTPGNGHWEINIASLTSSNPDRTLVQAPYFDINYGLGERTQLKVETGWVFSSGQNASTYPQYQFHAFYSKQDASLSTPENELFLPIEFSKTFGNFQINPELGYLSVQGRTQQGVFGVVLAYENLKPWEPLFEIHGNTEFDGTGTELLLNAGGRYTVNANLNLLFALGHTVLHLIGEPTELDTYLGVQLEI